MVWKLFIRYPVEEIGLRRDGPELKPEPAQKRESWGHVSVLLMSRSGIRIILRNVQVAW